MKALYLIAAGVIAAGLLASALAFTHFRAYTKGKHDGEQDVLAEWTASVAAANAEAQRLERARQSKLDDVARIAAARANDDRRRAGSVDVAAVRMHDAIDATERAVKDPGDAAAKTAAALRADLRSCVDEYRALGKDAAGFAADSLMYQEGWPE